jgi:hypothetical protein
LDETRQYARVTSGAPLVPWDLVSWAVFRAHAAWFSHGTRFGDRKEARQFDRGVFQSAVAELIFLQGVVALVTVGALWLVDIMTRVDPTQPLIMIPAFAPMTAVVLANIGLLVLIVHATLGRRRNGGTTPYLGSLTRSRDARMRIGWGALILALPTSALAYLTF